METTHTHNHSQHIHTTHKDGHVHTNGHKHVLMGIFAYLGPLVIIPFIVAKDNAFVKFHIKQGLVLLFIDVMLWFTGNLLGFLIFILLPLMLLLKLVSLVFTILGIINVIQGKEKELPYLGKYASIFTI